MKSPTPDDPMDLFRTRDSANTGIKLELVNPIDGKPTEHWIQIAGIDSDVYHKANTRAMRQIATLGEVSEDERHAAISAGSLDIIASLVLDWSFDKPCTPDNVREFLLSAPQIRNAVNVSAGNRALFMNSNSQSSPLGTEKKPS
jgi:hypothetical protein